LPRSKVILRPYAKMRSTFSMVSFLLGFINPFYFLTLELLPVNIFKNVNNE